MNSPHSSSPVNRRTFLQRTSTVAAGAAAALHFPHLTSAAAGADIPIRIGVIGCGGRGTGAAADALGAATRVIYPSKGYHTEDVAGAAQAKNIQVVALCDLFPDRLQRCREQLKLLSMQIPDERCFAGFDGYKQLLALADVNYVILATPPHFRPMQLRAAIEAGKHVFIEKPAAVDGPGVVSVIESGELAKQKGLGIAAGTQRRHQPNYQETIRRIQDGAIGDIIACRAYWNGGVIWVIEPEPGWSEMEWQVRNWNYFTWLSGDHIVEQHVHNLDIINWAMNAHPIRALALGGRQARPNKNYGHIYDHFAVEFEYPNGVRLASYCRQMHGCDGKVEEAVVGAKGHSNCQDRIYAAGSPSWRYRGPTPNPYQQEHLNLIQSIQRGQPINEARAIAESTATGILGREAAYSGKTIEWDSIVNSKAKLGPAKYEFGALPFPDVAVPGAYQST